MRILAPEIRMICERVLTWMVAAERNSGGGESMRTREFPAVLT